MDIKPSSIKVPGRFPDKKAIHPYTSPFEHCRNIYIYTVENDSYYLVISLTKLCIKLYYRRRVVWASSARDVALSLGQGRRPGNKIVATPNSSQDISN